MMFYISKKKFKQYKGYNITKVTIFDYLNHETKIIYLVSEEKQIIGNFETLYDARNFINNVLV